MFRRELLVAGFLLGVGWTSHAQEPATPEQVPPTQPLPAPQGQVLFSTEHPFVARQPESSSSLDSASEGPPDTLPKPAVTDAERDSVRIVGYDLDLHLVPAEAREQVRAVLQIRNGSAASLSRIPLQLSSTLRFLTVSSLLRGQVTPLVFTQSPVATDADHTGYAEEAVIVPARPLAPGESVTLYVLYGGTVAQSSARLDLLGVSPEKAAETDWDRIAPVSDNSTTALRGFGNVLWYPVTAPLALLGEGNKLFALAGEQKLRNQGATMGLRLTVEYTGDPPEGAIFDGELRPLTRVADAQDEPVEASHGVATLEFESRPLGFRLPSLFLTAQNPVHSDTLVIVTPNPERISPYAGAAQRVQTLVSDWFGVTPLRPLLLLDHPGQPFEDGALLVGQLATRVDEDLTARLLVGPLTAAWFRSGQPWIADGLSEFMRLLWTEREAGRKAAQSQLEAGVRTLALAEPAPGAAGGQPLTASSSEVFYRTKAAAVWWQLRDLLGEDVLRQGLQAYRHSETLNARFDADPTAMQKTLEKVSGKELGWFFGDWVYRDVGLPDLSIVQVNTRPLPARAGKETGYLVAVEVRNAGDAAAEVPVTVSSGNLTATERVRVAGGAIASVRIVFQGTPERVKVNDGSTPEIGQSEHTFLIKTLE